MGVGEGCTGLATMVDDDLGVTDVVGSRVVEKALLERDHHVGAGRIREFDDVASVVRCEHEDFVGATGFGHDVHGTKVAHG